MERMKRKLLTLVCVCGLTLSLAAGASAAEFTDVRSGAWYEKQVQAVAEKGIMTGTTATTFAPDAYVTRATVLTVLWRMEGSPEPSGIEGFPDVKEGSWCDKAARWAKEVRIADGYDDGRLGASDQVTREQLALFLSRYTYYKGGALAEGVLSLYPDGDKVSKWAVDGMKHAVGAGLITGTSQNTLSPLGYATRAELAVILDRLMTAAQG